MLALRVWPLLFLAAVGCVSNSGFHRSISEMSWAESRETNDQEIRTIQSLRPQLVFPCRIAVALEDKRGSERWSSDDRRQLQQWAKSLEAEGLASDVVFMSSMFIQKGESLRDLRAAAARYGADALLVLSRGTDRDEWMNSLAAFNLTIVGGFVVPASHSRARHVIQAGLIDVNNGYLYCSIDGEGEHESMAPSFLLDPKVGEEVARRKALAAFGEQMLMQIRGLSKTVRMVKNAPRPAFPPSLQPVPELPAPKPTPADLLPAIPPGALSLVSAEAKPEPTVLPSSWPRGLNVTVPTGIAVAR